MCNLISPAVGFLDKSRKSLKLKLQNLTLHMIVYYHSVQISYHQNSSVILNRFHHFQASDFDFWCFSFYDGSFWPVSVPKSNSIPLTVLFWWSCSFSITLTCFLFVNSIPHLSLNVYDRLVCFFSIFIKILLLIPILFHLMSHFYSFFLLAFILDSLRLFNLSMSILHRYIL